MKKITQLFIKVAAVFGLALSAQAQSPVAYFYSDYLVATNLVLTNVSANTSLGVSNLVAANYDIHGPYLSTKGVTASDPNAVGVTIETVFATPSANSIATNLIFTIAPVLDDSMAMPKNGFPYPYNSTFTITNVVPQAAGTNAYLVQVPATNFLGARKFKVVSVNYAGTNAYFTILSMRGGFWY